VIGVIVVRPEHESDVGFDIGHGFGNGQLSGFGDLELGSGEIEKTELSPMLFAQGHGPVLQFLFAALRWFPIAVIADQRQDHNPVVFAHGFQKDSGNPEYAIVVMGADAPTGLDHGN